VSDKHDLADLGAFLKGGQRVADEGLSGDSRERLAGIVT